MSSHNDPVKPIPFEVAPPPNAPDPAARSSAEPAARRAAAFWVLPALGALLLLAAIVIFMLPAALDPGATAPAAKLDTGDTAPAAVAEAGSGVAADASEGSATADISPWSDAQLAHQRQMAQDVAAELHRQQISLQEHGVEQWAAEDFAAATALAAAGDGHYRDRQFDEAISQYRQALAALQSLEESKPDVLASLLDQARRALAAADADAARSALAVATLIAPDSGEVAELQQRVEALPKLLPLLDEARVAENAGDLPRAKSLLQEAAALDPQHASASADLQRVTAVLQGQGFSQAMSEGYAALGEGRFDAARKAFTRAAGLQQGSKEAADAIAEVTAAETVQRLANLDQQGRREEQQEQWASAVATYEQARKIDGGVLFAREGLERASARARLDEQLRTVLANPRRLSDTAVAASTAQLLQQAREVTPRGPVLENQIAQLDTALTRASTPVAVTLRSDRQTEVTVLQVAKLGTFAEHDLTLRPGEYTAVGTRDGYRDVRVNFTITPDAAPAPVTVICSEPI